MAGNRKVFEEAMREGADAAWEESWDQAIAAYQRALAEFPDDIGVLTGLGLAYSGAGQLEAALNAYQQANKLSPDDPVLYGHMGQVYEQLGQGKEAADAYMASAERYLSQQNAPQLALEHWQDAIRACPDYAQAHAQLLQYYQRQGQVRAAVKECLALARIYLRQRKHDYAIQACQYALKLAPHDPEVLAALDELRHGEQATAEPPPETAPPLAGADEPIGPAILDFQMTPSVEADEEGEERGSPVEITRQTALTQLAESFFEEEEVTSPSGAAAGLSRMEINALIGKAIDFQTRGKTDQAIAAYEQVIRTGTDQPAVCFNLGLLYQEKLRFDDAISQLERAVAHADDRLGSHFALGECHRALGHTDEALTHFIEALKIVDLTTIPGDRANDLIQIYDGLAEDYAAKGDQKQALEFTKSLTEFFSQKDWAETVRQARRQLDTLASEGPTLSLAETLAIPGSQRILESISLAQEYTQRDMCYTALEECYHALGISPTYLPIHREMAQVLVAMDKMDQAVSKFVVIADAYRMRGSFRPAMAMYQRALKLTPMDTTVRTKLIDLLISDGKTDLALEHYLTLADSYHHLAQIDQARETYQEALKLAQRGSADRQWEVRILHRIGDIYMQRVDWRRAIEIYEQIRKLAPRDERARSALKDLYYRFDRPELAIAEIDGLLKIYRDKGEPERVFEVLEDAVLQRSGDIPLRTRLAQAHLDAGNVDQALEHLDKLGDLQLEAGRYEDAKATIRAIIALHPPNVTAYQQLLDQVGERGSN